MFKIGDIVRLSDDVQNSFPKCKNPIGVVYMVEAEKLFVTIGQIRKLLEIDQPRIDVSWHFQYGNIKCLE